MKTMFRQRQETIGLDGTVWLITQAVRPPSWAEIHPSLALPLIYLTQKYTFYQTCPKLIKGDKGIKLGDNFRLLSSIRGIQGMICPASIFKRHWLCQGINLLKRSALTKLTSCTHFVQLRSVGSGKSAAQSQIGYRRFHF